MFIDVKLEDYTRMLKSSTGEEYGVSDLLRVGWRIETLIRLFNLREGLDPQREDVLPPRIWEPVPSGPSKGRRAFVSEEDFRRCLLKFYEYRGWDEEGRPREDTVKTLGLDRLL